ncbi:MAG: hypothetical protein HY692_05300 [Cyanobacteria bacterium NC_groundwater_1444_Ag_S-0.65um_54_12]|nr:hypothetical protein [Cyanobacteria bacterium NC_groundwater_1444_Ag_S-0.65um_54_12]
MHRSPGDKFSVPIATRIGKKEEEEMFVSGTLISKTGRKVLQSKVLAAKEEAIASQVKAAIYNMSRYFNREVCLDQLAISGQGKIRQVHGIMDVDLPGMVPFSEAFQGQWHVGKKKLAEFVATGIDRLKSLTAFKI